MKRSQEDKSFLNMAGEFLVAGELNRRKILSAVTYGTSKSADVWAFDRNSKRAVRIEVKTTEQGTKNWIIGEKALVRHGWDQDLFWVLVLLPQPHPSTSNTTDEMRGKHSPRFFVFSCEELARLICTRYDAYRAQYRAKHSAEFLGKPVLDLPTYQAEPFENSWDKIKLRVSTSRP